MKLRIAMWAVAGLLIAGGWAVLLLLPVRSPEPLLWTLARITQPVVNLPFGLRFYWVILANAATYALVGLFVEGLRQIVPQN
jgi:hypothetical protein